MGLWVWKKVCLDVTNGVRFWFFFPNHIEEERV